MENTKEKHRTGFTTFGPLSQIKDIGGWGSDCGEWRGCNREMSLGKLPSVPLYPPPSMGLRTAERPSGCHVKPISQKFWMEAQEPFPVRWWAWNRGLEPWSLWFPVRRRKLAGQGAGGSHRQREAERGTVHLGAHRCPTALPVVKFLFCLGSLEVLCLVAYNQESQIVKLRSSATTELLSAHLFSHV